MTACENEVHYLGTSVRMTVAFTDFDDEPLVPEDYEVRAWRPKASGAVVEIESNVVDGKVVAVFDAPEAGEWTVLFEVTQPVKVSTMHRLSIEATVPHS